MAAARTATSIAAAALCTLAPAASLLAATAEQARSRIDRDAAAGRPVVVHLVVALCDNDHQGIVPVPRHLGNGQDARSNLYWGARYGVKTYFQRDGGWRAVDTERPGDSRILDRVVFFDRLQRGGSSVPVYVVADA